MTKHMDEFRIVTCCVSIHCFRTHTPHSHVSAAEAGASYDRQHQTPQTPSTSNQTHLAFCTAASSLPLCRTTPDSALISHSSLCSSYAATLAHAEQRVQQHGVNTACLLRRKAAPLIRKQVVVQRRMLKWLQRTHACAGPVLVW